MRGAKYISGARNIDRHRLKRLLYGKLHAREGGFVKYIPRARDDRSDFFEISDINFVIRRARVNAFGAPASRKVIYDMHFIPPLKERADNMRAYESGAAGNHRFSSHI
jgi:hypothetical protein